MTTALCWKYVFLLLILGALIVLVIRVSELSSKVVEVQDFIVRAVTIEDLIHYQTRSSR
jgi:hypothetical protein